MKPLVGIVMGSISDRATMENAFEVLEEFKISYEKKIVSAHRTPDAMFDYASTARDRGIQVIIAAAGGSAHLPGMTASKTILPVIGVPIQSKTLHGIDSLLSIVQMPKGVPVGTVAIGNSGAYNAALLAIQILGLKNDSIATQLEEYRLNLKELSISSNKKL